MARGALVMVGVALALVAGAVRAQPAGPRPAMIPAGPQAMPGDYFDLSPEAQLKVPLGPPAGRNPRPQPAPTPSSIPGPGLPLALEAAQVAERTCAADGYTIAVAVTDSAGNLKAALAPDGTRANGVYMAMHKALTVVKFKMSTLQFRAKVEADPSLMAQVEPNMALLPGGVPIFAGDRFVGAIAVSGAAAHEEEKCADAGIAAVRARLR